MRLQFIGVSVVSFISVFAVLSTHLHLLTSTTPSLIGLSLAYALPITGTLAGLLGSATETEKEIVRTAAQECSASGAVLTGVCIHRSH